MLGAGEVQPQTDDPLCPAWWGGGWQVVLHGTNGGSHYASPRLGVVRLAHPFPPHVSRHTSL